MQIGLITAPRHEWELWCQEDGGNQYVIGRYARRDTAEIQLQAYESRSLKQVYWLKRVDRGS